MKEFLPPKSVVLKVSRFFLVVILAFSWIFSGWPQIFNFPPNIQEAQAVTCGFGTDIGGGQCRGFITSGTTFTVPNDWNSSNNTIEVISGGGGGCGHNPGGGNGGGGGGAYSQITNLTLTPSATIDLVVGVAGGFRGDGGDTWFNGTTCAGASVCADGGIGAVNQAGGTGGTAANSVGTLKYDGGTGGTGNGTADSQGGGGGAGGPNGAGGAGGFGDDDNLTDGVGGGGGGNGGRTTTGGYVGGDGRVSDTVGADGGNNFSNTASSGGTGGNGGPGEAGADGGGGGGGSDAQAGGNGGNGIDWDATHGSGGGGGGGGDSAGGGTGGLYGGGGGGGVGNQPTGAQGIIVITYTPAAGPTLTFSISDSAIGFSNLDAVNERWATGDGAGSATEVSAHTISASTNGASGYAITINGSTLTSGANTITAIGATAANVTAGNGTEQFGIRLTASGGNGAVSAPYNGAANNYALDTAAFPDQIASDPDGDDVSTTYSVFYAANISAATEAGTYTSTLTYIATGTF